MGRLDIFEVPNTYLSDKKFQADLKRVNDIAAKGYENLTATELNTLIYNLERMAVSSRRKLERSSREEAERIEMFYKTKDIRNADKLVEAYENLPVKLKFFEYEGVECLCVFTPFSFRRGMKESFYLADYVKAEVCKHKEEVEDFFVARKQKYWINVIRVADRFNPSKHKDNDNLETSGIINRIFAYGGGISDNPLRMSFSSDFAISDNEGTHGLYFIVYPYQDRPFGSNSLLKTVNSNNQK